MLACACGLQRVVLERLPLIEQMILFSRSRALIAVHGQARN
jgi:hypothetical protein